MVYTTPELVQAELRASIAFDATTVPSLTDVTTWIDEESNSIDNDVGYTINATQYDETFSFSGEDKIYARVAPIISVDTLYYNTSGIGSSDYSTSWSTKAEGTDFYVTKDRGEIIPIFTNFSPSEREQNIRLIYTAGYVTPPAVYRKLATKMVSSRVLSSLLYNNVNDRNDGGSISVGSISIVEPGNYGVGSYDRLQKDIDALKQQVTSGFGVHRYGNY